MRQFLFMVFLCSAIVSQCDKGTSLGSAPDLTGQWRHKQTEGNYVTTLVYRFTDSLFYFKGNELYTPFGDQLIMFPDSGTWSIQADTLIINGRRADKRFAVRFTSTNDSVFLTDTLSRLFLRDTTSWASYQ